MIALSFDWLVEFIKYLWVNRRIIFSPFFQFIQQLNLKSMRLHFSELEKLAYYVNAGKGALNSNKK